VITILEGDCCARMKDLNSNSISTIFADPPYNTGNTKDKTVKYDRNKDFAAKNWTNFHSEWDAIEDYYTWSKAWMEEAYRLLRVGGTLWLCGSFHNIPEAALALKAIGFWTIQWVSWCIPNSFPHLSGRQMTNSNQTLIWARKGEKAHYYSPETAKRYTENNTGLRDYWLIPNDSRPGRLWKHPSKKPPALVRRALDISTPKNIGAVVLDPFGGSGTTGEVANELGLDCILIEKNAAYVEIMKARLYGTQRS
jgi:modification methylase